MKQIKAFLTIVLVALFVAQAVYMVAAETTIQHPQVKVFGNVQKTVYVGRSIFEYKDDQGLSSTLPFERQDENITISFANIVFDENFENKSIASSSEGGSTELTLTKDLLTENGQEYIYLKAVNNTALSTWTSYKKSIGLIISEKSVTNEYYLVFTAKAKKIGANLDGFSAIVMFKFKDTGATERLISLWIGQHGATGYKNGWAAVGSYDFLYAASDNTWLTVQVKIQDLLDLAGQTWTVSKLISITYMARISTSGTLDSSSGVEVKIRHAFATPAKIYIDDPFYTNGLIVNGTSGQFTPSAGDTIQVYGANVTKIVGVTIPWQAELTPEINGDPDNLKMQYTWNFTMPKSPTGVGDTLTFSSTNMTLYGYKDGDAWDKLYVNGVDKLSSIANKKVPATTGSNPYWTYGLASSLTEGTMYQIIARIGYTADEYDALTEAPLWYQNFWAWLQYKFWALIILIASTLGISTSFAVKQRRKAQIPKVKNVDLAPLTPLFSSAPFAMMDLTALSFDLTTAGIILSLVIIAGCVFLILRRPQQIRQLKRRLTDKDIRVGRKSYNLLNMAIFLFAGSGILVLLSFLPGFAFTWMPTLYLGGLLIGFVLLFIDALK